MCKKLHTKKELATSGCGRWQREALLGRLPSSHQSQQWAPINFLLKIQIAFVRKQKKGNATPPTIKASIVFYSIPSSAPISFSSRGLRDHMIILFSAVYQLNFCLLSNLKKGSYAIVLLSPTQGWVYNHFTQVQDGEAWFSPPMNPPIAFHSSALVATKALIYQGKTSHCML